MSLSQGEQIAIGVCVPLAIIILALAIFGVWFKFIRVRTVNFKVSYVDENGNIVTDEAVPPEGVASSGAAKATNESVAPPGPRPADLNNNGDAQQAHSLQMQQLAAQAQLQSQVSELGARPLPPGLF